jgi:predicted porin
MTSPIGLGLRFAIALVCVIAAAPAARADALSDMKAQMQQMQQQMQQLQKQLQDMTQKVQQQQQQTDKVQAQQQQQQEQIKAVVPEKDHAFLEHKPGTATFYTPGGEITAYGNLDVSLDATTKGIKNKTAPGASPPEFRPPGRVGWLPAVSTNLSYLGLRGFQSLGDFPANFVWQLETQLDIAATSGSAETNSNQSNQVKGALTSRNSFIGLSSEQYGSLYVGKSDAPYKNATQRMNPFSGMIGDYSVVMGNSGGDNRVEFGTRLDHSIWYESPKFAGFTFNALFSPGQNRSSSSDNIAAGESDCTGGNIPGSGGTSAGGPIACNDGAFSDAVSADIVYSEGPLYVVAAYERHMKVNRSSDILGQFSAGLATPLAQKLFAQDTADEDAVKLGAQYAFPFGTTVSGIVERMHRYVPGDLEFQNERQRWGTWLAISHKLTDKDTIAVGWAHAFKTPGDPGQHNTAINQTPGGGPGDTTGGAHANNSANMITAMVRHQFNKYISAYFDWAMTINGPFAHYDLGAGGRAVTTDCHDGGVPASGGETSNPHCWAGGHLMGVSAGMKFQF